MGRAGEFEVIRRFFAPLAAAAPGALGLADDAAVLEVEAGRRLVVTTDTVVAGGHFPHQASPETIAAKMLRVNLSDLAAMGAEAFAYTLSVALPEDVDDDWLERFSAALAGEQDTFRVTLIGGDTVATPGPLTLTVCALGTVAEGRELRRSAARPGDGIYVSGTIGDAALGLLALGGELDELSADHRQALIERYHRPRPRMELGARLAGVAHGATDISDGLVADLGHICEASGVGARLEAGRVPLSAAGRAALDAAPERMATVLTGGDDYEILFTAPTGSNDAVERLSGELDLPLTAVGRISTGPGGVAVIDERGAEMVLERGGFSHF